MTQALATDLPDWSSAVQYRNDVKVGVLNLAAGATRDVSLSPYSSMVVACNSNTVSTDTIIQVDVHQAATVNGVGDTVPYTEYLTNHDSVARTGEWVLPCWGGSARFTNRSTGAVNLVVYGSSRQVSDVVPLGGHALTRRIHFVGALVANVTSAELVAADGGFNSTFFEGDVLVSVQGGDGHAVLVTLNYLDQGGTVYTMALNSWTVPPYTLRIAHPAAVVRWSIQANANTIASTWDLNITKT